MDDFTVKETNLLIEDFEYRLSDLIGKEVHLFCERTGIPINHIAVDLMDVTTIDDVRRKYMVQRVRVGVSFREELNV